MRHGWEIKKLGEVCEIERGGSPRPIKEYLTNSQEGINWIKIGDADGSKYITKTKEKIKPEGIKKSRYVYSGDFLLSNSMSFGRPYILAIDGCIHDGWLVIHDTNNYFNKSYLYYYLGSSNIYKEFKRLAVGGVVNNLNTEIVKNVNVYIPPLSEQERIVEELDLLSDVIAKKREQLKQLDTLAQSIFYDMFGDPIINEKGWKTKKLGETSTLHNGRAFKPTDWSNSGLPIVRIQNLNNPTLPFNYYDGEVANNHRLYGGELLYAWSGTPDTSFGAHIWYGGDAVLNQHIFKIEYNKDLLNIKYFVFNLNGIVNSMFDKTHGGVGLQHITKGTLTSQNICLPPLYLQQQFASKIESIEKQKELIKQSLSEVQQLFDSRMDYYFG